MAKAILKYDLSDPDDRLEHLRAIKAADMAMVIWDFVYNTRKRMENKIAETGADAYSTLDKILDDFNDNLSEHEINIDDLVV
jgi:hypothetical protein